MTGPAPIPLSGPEGAGIVRDAARYSSLILMIGCDPDDPETMRVNEFRKDERPIDPRLVARVLRDLADRIEAREAES